jgi:hypothetical protein
MVKTTARDALTMVEHIRATERERCAQLCEKLASEAAFAQSSDAALKCAREIRELKTET